MAWQPMDMRLRILPRSTNRGLTEGIREAGQAIAGGIHQKRTEDRQDRLAAEGRTHEFDILGAQQDFQSSEAQAQRAWGSTENRENRLFQGQEGRLGRELQERLQTGRLEHEGLQGSLNRLTTERGQSLGAHVTREGHDLQRWLMGQRIQSDREQMLLRLGFDADMNPIPELQGDSDRSALDALMQNPSLWGGILGRAFTEDEFGEETFDSRRVGQQWRGIQDVLGAPPTHTRGGHTRAAYDEFMGVMSDAQQRFSGSGPVRPGGAQPQANEARTTPPPQQGATRDIPTGSYDPTEMEQFEKMGTQELAGALEGVAHSKADLSLFLPWMGDDEIDEVANYLWPQRRQTPAQRLSAPVGQNWRR